MKLTTFLLSTLFLVTFQLSAQNTSKKLEKYITQVYERTKQRDDIKAYQSFVKSYPNAKEYAEALNRLQELEYAHALKTNSIKQYRYFIHNYPTAAQFNDIKNRLDELEFQAVVKKGSMYDLASLAFYSPQNQHIAQTENMIFAMANRIQHAPILSYYNDSLNAEVGIKSLLVYRDYYTRDGLIQSTMEFYANKNVQEKLVRYKNADFEMAYASRSINIENYKVDDFEKFDTYIKKAAPRMHAFHALQCIIQNDIQLKKWDQALNKVKVYENYFIYNDQQYRELGQLLSTTYEENIKAISVGAGVNKEHGQEYVPVISADEKTLYFCGEDRRFSIGGEDIFYSKNINGNWSEALPLRALSNIYYNDAPVNISNDGNTLYTFKSGRLQYSTKTIAGWTKTTDLPKEINSAPWQADISLSSNGNVMVFASGDAKNDNNIDIVISFKNEQGQWSMNKSIGNTINTPGIDRSPFLHPDMKTLYFSSDRGGLGNLDVYMSRRLSDTCWDCWSTPINLGKEINTSEKDWGYKITTDGSKAYFSKTAQGNSDIYYVNLPESMQPEKVAVLHGKMLDKNKRGINTSITWEDLSTGKIVGTSKTNPVDGSYYIVLPLGKMYGYYLSNQTYFPLSQHIDLQNTHEAVNMNVNIQAFTIEQLKASQIEMPLNNLFFQSNSAEIKKSSMPELNRIAKLIKAQDLKIEIAGHADNMGNEEVNQKLSEERALAVKNALIKAGCKASLINTIGFGSTRPVASNLYQLGRDQNRRVEIKILK